MYNGQNNCSVGYSGRLGVQIPVTTDISHQKKVVKAQLLKAQQQVTCGNVMGPRQ